jgi:acetyl esterase/lipase
MAKIIGCLFLLAMFVSCEKDSEETVEASTLPDIAYGTNARHRMDVYLPRNRNANTPVVVLLHGGGFVAGDKSDFSVRAQNLSAKGFAVLNVNYRLVDMEGILDNPIVHKPSAVKIADQLKDLRSAIEHAATKTIEWNVSSDKWYIAGHSAGATLALLYAYGDKNADGRIKAAANWAGATTFAFSDESEIELVDPRVVEVLYRAIGAEAKNANKLAYMAASPYWVAYQGNAIATINIRPEMNSTSDLPDGSKELYKQFTDMLNAKGVTNKYVEVAGADHGFSQAGKWDLVIDETASFFKR